MKRATQAKATPIRPQVNPRPLHDRVLVLRSATETVTEGGLIVPDAAQEEAAQGIVVAVGPGEVCDTTGVPRPMGVKVGDVVAFGKYGGSEILIDGQKLLILREEEIHLVLETS